MADGRTSGILRVLVHPTHRFLRDYLLKAAFLDGFEGFVACCIDAHMTYLKYAKLRDLLKRGDEAGNGRGALTGRRP
jgi:hypothetical protein